MNYGNTPVELCSRNAWNRVTPGGSYTQGVDVFEGIAQIVGAPAMVAAMNSFYTQHAGMPVSTEMLEAHLLSVTGETEIVDAFHRFVYGFNNPTGSVDLWLRDETGHLLINDLSLVEGWPVHNSLLKARPVVEDRVVLAPELDCGQLHTAAEPVAVKFWTSRNPEPRVARAFKLAKAVLLKRRKINLFFSQRNVVAWRVQVPEDAKSGDTLRADLVLRNFLGRCVLGGLSLEINIRNLDKRG